MKKLFLRRLYIVFLFNLVLLFIVAVNYLDFLENTEGILLKIYLLITAVSHFFIIGLVPLIASLIVYGITRSQTAGKSTSIFMSTLTLVLLVLDLTIFNQFRYHLSPIVFKMVFGKRSSDIFQFSGSDMILPILFIIGVIALQFVFYYIAEKKMAPGIRLRAKMTSIILLCFLLVSHLFYAWSDANFYQPVTQLKNVFPAFFPLTADSLLMKLNLVDEKYVERNKQLKMARTSNTVRYPLQPINSGASSQKNILLIVIDSWRSDYMTSDITPNIYNLSKRSQVFNNHMSGSNMTTGGIFSLFYGIPATYYDTFTGQEIAPVMMNELQRQNYSMKILGSSTLENPPFNKNVFARIPNLRLSSKAEKSAARDQEITDEWLTAIDKDKNPPFFGFLFYDAAHAFDHPDDYPLVFKPSIAEVPYLKFNDDFDPLTLINRYKNSLHYIDGLVGKVLADLERKGLLESTLVIITSDHGQEFNDMKKGYWQHGGNFSKVQIHVPLIIFDFEKKPNVYNHLTLHYDVAPTILTDVLGVKNKFEDYSFGQNLYKPIKRDYFVCGYNDRFAFIEKTKITNIYPAGLFDVTDQNLNTLDSENANFETITKGFKDLGRFYRKN